MTQPATGFRYFVTAYAISQIAPVGYVASQYEFRGQPWQNGIDSPLNLLKPTQLSSFAVELGYDFATRLYDPEVIYSTCTGRRSSTRRPSSPAVSPRRRPETGLRRRAAPTTCHI